MSERKHIECPPELLVNEQEYYLLGHYRHLLTRHDLFVVKYRSLTIKLLGARQQGKRGEHIEQLLERERKHWPEAAATIQATGFRSLIQDIAQRLLDEHGDEIFLNLCSKCGGLCRTPKAKQCLRCGHDWHRPNLCKEQG